ncbi:MAG: hypothetical protein LC662_05100, partial [Rhodothermaceae bacterium]|nr:hypothetical protein [Rhodothermaceae bacterium]
ISTKPGKNAMNAISTINPFTIFTRYLATGCLVLLMSCTGNDRPADEMRTQMQEQTETGSAEVVEVIAMHNMDLNRHTYQMGTKEVPSGWTTFRFRNATTSDHFFMIYRAPDEAIAAAEEAGLPLVDHWFRGITTPFQLEFNPFAAGVVDYDTFVTELVGSITEKAPWFFDPGAVNTGGPGFTSAGRTSETTVFLEPGEYIAECYVKDEDEQFHSYLGMLQHFTVTVDSSGAREPEATLDLTISSENGITSEGEVTAGSHVVRISFEDQVTYAHLLGHNVQLVKLTDSDDEELLGELAGWMDWTQPGSLVHTAPAGAEFLGGTMQMTGGSTAYVNVDILPGDYAWIAEIPDPAGHGMLKTFTVE